MPETPETTSFLIMGLIISLGIMGLYVVSLWARFRSAGKDMAMLAELGED